MFIPVSKRDLKLITGNGLAGGVIAFRTLKQARTVKGRVLVVSSKAFTKGKIKPKHIENGRPYRRAVAITAGGGVLLRNTSSGLETVLIFRKGKWDLPKGKRERGESKRTCAVREVNEELGISDARIVSKMGTTIHGYRGRRRRYFVKTTHWYTMVTEATTFLPQAEEKITDARWVPIDEAIRILDFAVLRDLLIEA
ncbi:NUDIX domain-containing protein [Rhodothermus sp. AH-315-K08]|nr:NUDIX domain-containing protein [Rhodothermus sp. AH-315-K08]